MRAEAAVDKTTKSVFKWNEVSNRGRTTSTNIRTIGKKMDEHIDRLGNRLNISKSGNLAEGNWSIALTKYSDKEYWDDRYVTDVKTEEWLEDYNSLKPILSSLMKRKDRLILNLGCGNSTLQEDMYDDGYKRIVNIDISQPVITQMIKRSMFCRPSLKYYAMDATDISKFTTGSFDFVIDKSTIDALFCSDQAHIVISKVLKEV
jgi:SAM-dependent methyltransferase